MLHCVMICCIKPYYNIILSYIIFYFVYVCACRYLQQHAQTYTWMVPRRRVTASPPPTTNMCLPSTGVIQTCAPGHATSNETAI